MYSCIFVVNCISLQNEFMAKSKTYILCLLNYKI